MSRGRPKKMSIKRRGEQLKAIERKPIRPLERQRMRPWLIDLLDRNTCHQLVWINKRVGTFRVSWKHAAGQTFDPVADATLFELWARHTGKYFTGDLADPKKWKANFRCALHSLQDVHENKALGIKKGNNAFRVYTFLNEKKAKQTAVKKEKGKNAVNDESDEEFEVLRNVGTKSRPKTLQQDCLDSEGSDTGQSPYNDSSHSDWEMGDLRRQEYEAEKSPLPNFEKLYQSCPGGTTSLPRPAQSCAPALQTSQTSQLTNSDSEKSDQVGDDYNDDIDESKWMTDLTTICEYNEHFWSFVIDGNLDVQEEVVTSGENEFFIDHLSGPNVIVLPQQRIYNDVEYTSIADM